MQMFQDDMLKRASVALQTARDAHIRIATAETCTAGLLSACLTSVPGASEVFERGFALYHASAKATGLGVPESLSREHGAVSAEVTGALAQGVLTNSSAGVSAAITGYAGPGGGSDKDPVGTVYVAASSKHKPTTIARFVFAGDRDDVRLAAVAAALDALAEQVRAA